MPIDFRLVENTEAMAEAQMAFLEQRQNRRRRTWEKSVIGLTKPRTKSQRKWDDVADGPFQLGVPLKKEEPIMEIRTIQDEERRVTIEGYVFDAEVRELRSGRSLLTIKVTDYTDSILVKMFSRDKEDAEMMKTLKKGHVVACEDGIKTIHLFVISS